MHTQHSLIGNPTFKVSTYALRREGDGLVSDGLPNAPPLPSPFLHSGPVPPQMSSLPSPSSPSCLPVDRFFGS